MTLKQRLIGSFALLLVPSALLAVWQMINLQSVASEASVVASTNHSRSQVAGQINGWVRQEYALTVQLAVTEPGPARDALLRELDSVTAATLAAIETYASGGNDIETTTRLGAIRSAYGNWESVRDQAVNNAAAQNAAASDLLLGSVKPASDRLTVMTGELVAHHGQREVAAGANILAVVDDARSALFVGNGVLFLAGAALALLLSRNIVNSIGDIVRALTRGADQTTGAAAQVSSASQSLAQGATEQAASLQETSSSLEEMSGSSHKERQNSQDEQTARRIGGECVDRREHAGAHQKRAKQGQREG